MIGAFLNALGIFIGALFGLAMHRPAGRRAQEFFKAALGFCTVIYGLRLVYENVMIFQNAHGTIYCLKQAFVAAVAVVLGYWLGKALHFQALSNRLGHRAATVLAAAQKNPPGATGAGFAAITILFCAAPLGIIGAVMDGLENYWYLLLLKAVMDGLAMMSFVNLFRWPVALAAAPVYFFFNGIALPIRLELQPWMDAHGLTASVGVAAGLVTCSMALVILEVRRVELANYLPALAVAPLLAYWVG